MEKDGLNLFIRKFIPETKGLYKGVVLLAHRMAEHTPGQGMNW